MKGKGKGVPGLDKHYTMKIYDGVEILLHAFLTSALD
jgi:hypothetical protein